MGGPDNNIQYLLEGFPFIGANTTDVGGSEFLTSLNISVDMVDAALHKGVYTCEATNIAGSGTANTTVFSESYW